MARIRAEYSIFPVKMKSGKTVYYYQTYDNFGRRTSKKSTGKNNKTAADAWVKDQLKKNPVLAGDCPIYCKKVPRYLRVSYLTRIRPYPIVRDIRLTD